MTGEAQRLLERLSELGWSVAVAESLTGGLVTAALIAVPGASQTVRGGVVAYAVDTKGSLLGVDAALLDAHGAVHPEVARQMAAGVRDTFGGDGHDVQVGIATTGIAGPDTPDGQPVGTVYVGVATPSGTHVATLLLHGTRDEIRAAAAHEALRITHDAL